MTKNKIKELELRVSDFLIQDKTRSTNENNLYYNAISDLDLIYRQKERMVRKLNLLEELKEKITLIRKQLASDIRKAKEAGTI